MILGSDKRKAHQIRIDALVKFLVSSVLIVVVAFFPECTPPQPPPLPLSRPPPLRRGDQWRVMVPSPPSQPPVSSLAASALPLSPRSPGESRPVPRCSSLSSIAGIAGRVTHPYRPSRGSAGVSLGSPRASSSYMISAPEITADASLPPRPHCFLRSPLHCR
jgi:hypothetical protein